MAGNIVCQLRAGSHKSAAVVLWAFLDLTDDPEVFVLCRKKKGLPSAENRDVISSEHNWAVTRDCVSISSLKNYIESKVFRLKSIFIMSTPNKRLYIISH